MANFVLYILKKFWQNLALLANLSYNFYKEKIMAQVDQLKLAKNDDSLNQTSFCPPKTDIKNEELSKKQLEDFLKQAPKEAKNVN